MCLCLDCYCLWVRNWSPPSKNIPWSWRANDKFTCEFAKLRKDGKFRSHPVKLIAKHSPCVIAPWRCTTLVCLHFSLVRHLRLASLPPERARRRPPYKTLPTSAGFPAALPGVVPSNSGNDGCFVTLYWRQSSLLPVAACTRGSRVRITVKTRILTAFLYSCKVLW